MRIAMCPAALGIGAARALPRMLVWIVASVLAGTASAKETKLAVELTSPENGASYMAPAIVSLAATVTLIDKKDKGEHENKEKHKKKDRDDKGNRKSDKGKEHGNPHKRIVRVEFLRGATLIGTATAAPYAFTWADVAAGNYLLSARAVNAKGETVVSSQVAISVATNAPPTVTLVAPAQNAMVTAPANITVWANAADIDGSVTQVEFFADGNVIGTATTIPFTIQWANVSAGNYSLTARATDNNNAQTTSTPVNITVNQVAQVYYIHPDHLNTPRAITNGTGQLVWAWANDDPFGANVPNENPSGLGNFNCNLRLPGQYFDWETNTHYNNFRDYDPRIGRYVQSDPIALRGGINTYAYVLANPLGNVDPIGWRTFKICGAENGPKFPDNFGPYRFTQACIDHDACYDDCVRRPTKAECDRQFFTDTQNACRSMPWFWIVVGAQRECFSYSLQYSIAVEAAGKKAFVAARAKCSPCPR